MEHDIEEFLKTANFTPNWCEVDEEHKPELLNRAYANQHKDLSTLLGELEQIKNTIEDAKMREWNLANLLKYHNAGIKPE